SAKARPAGGAKATIGGSEEPATPRRHPGGGGGGGSGLRGDHEAEASLGLVVAHEGVLDLLGGEALVLGLGREHVVEAQAAIVEGGEAADPEVGRLQDLVEKIVRLLLGHREL